MQQTIDLGELRQPETPRPKQKFNTEQAIEDLAGVFTDPIIVYPGGGWEDSIPDWLKKQIPIDRLVVEMEKTRGGEPLASDTEALAYMMPAVMDHPLSCTWINVYLYLATRAMEKFGHGKTPDDIRLDHLGPDEARELTELKRWIYRQRVKARKERVRAERREAREKVEAQYEQLSLFGEGGDSME